MFGENVLVTIRFPFIGFRSGGAPSFFAFADEKTEKPVKRDVRRRKKSRTGFTKIISVFRERSTPATAREERRERLAGRVSEV